MVLVTMGKMDNPGFTQYLVYSMVYSGQTLEFGTILFSVSLILL